MNGLNFLIKSVPKHLTHWGRVTHTCVSKLTKLTIIASDNGLSPGRRQAIIWTSAGILLIGSLGTNLSEILIEMITFSFKKMRLKVSSAKWRPCCLGLNVLTKKLSSLCVTSPNKTPDGCSAPGACNTKLTSQWVLSGTHNLVYGFTETEMSFWWNFHHWLHWKLSKWQLPVQPVMKISSKWWHFHFSVPGPAAQLDIEQFVGTKKTSQPCVYFVRGIYRWQVDSPHKGPVIRKVFSWCHHKCRTGPHEISTWCLRNIRI